MKIPPKVIQDIISVVGKQNVCCEEASLLLNSYDCSLSHTRPDLVVTIEKAQNISPIVKILYAHKIPFIPKASSTNHAGSCCALAGGVVLNLLPLNRILQINTFQRYAIIEPGVITANLQQELKKLGFFYAPDPASERICTIGGNISQNASGARCLKYGGTLEHVLEIKVVLPNGKEVLLSRGQEGPDWVGLFCGSEGTLGIITQIKVKILPLSTYVKTSLVCFDSLENCIQTVTDLTAAGIVPSCVEAMDKVTIGAIEKLSPSGYPNVNALLILEIEGNALSQVQEEMRVIEDLCYKNKAIKYVTARNEEEREKLWIGRKSAYAAMACLAPNVMVGDGTVPRSELPRALKEIRKFLEENQIYASLLFHAGDGNFHPHIIFNERNSYETQKARKAIKWILQVCVDCGGTISGEHGVGVEKRRMMAYEYSKDTLSLFATIKKAIDPFQISNPLKLIPINYEEKAAEREISDDRIVNLIKEIHQRVDLKKPCTVVGSNSQLKSMRHNLLSTKKLNKIIDIDLANYTATVEAGVCINTFLEELGKVHAFCALMPSNGTVGGAFASGRFPEFLSSVIGIEVILPTGRYVKYGGKIMKNAAGYNLIRLFYGSKGRLGIVTRLVVRLFAKERLLTQEKTFSTKIECNEIYQKIKGNLDPNHLFDVI